MESKKDIPTKEDLDFIVDDGYNHDEDPTYEPKDSSSSDDDKYVVTGKEFKKLTRKAKKNSVLIHLIIQHVKKTNTWQHSQVERKFILDHQIIQTILFIKTKIEERGILLERQRLKINRES